MSYNVNAMNAYQQYGSSMAAGGGGTNMSGSSAKQGLGTKPSDAYKQYAETMTAGGGGQTMAGTGTSAYQQAQQMAGSDNDNSPAQLYKNSANAFTNAGVNLKDQTWTPSADPRLIYNENKFKTEEIVTDVKDYLRGTAIENALLEAQGFEAPRSALYTGENRPLTEQELQQYKPLFDLMDDSIEVEELSRMDREDQEALLEAIGVGNLGRMPQDTAFLGGDFDVATTNQQFIRDALRAKQIADELEKLSKEVDPNSPLQAEIQKLLEQVQGEEDETAPVVRQEMYEDMSTPVSPTDTITDDADGGAAPSDGKGIPNNIDLDFLGAREGFKLKAYVPTKNGKVIESSGVTVGTGVDLGSKNAKYFEGLDPEIEAKFSPYYGKQKKAAQDALKENGGFTLTVQQAEELDNFVKAKEFNSLKDKWDKTSDIKWDDLSTEKATTVASVAYQYGDLATVTPKFWGYTTSGDWQKAYEELMDFGDEYETRRRKEAALLRRDLSSTSLRPRSRPNAIMARN